MISTVSLIAPQILALAPMEQSISLRIAPSFRELEAELTFSEEEKAAEVAGLIEADMMSRIAKRELGNIRGWRFNEYWSTEG